MPKADYPKYEIKPFNPEMIKPTSVVQIIGPRNTGKSVLQLDLLYHLRRYFDYGVAMSPTTDTLKDWRGRIPLSSIYNRYRVDVLEAILRSQNRDLDDDRVTRPLFLLTDDCMYESKLLKSEPIRELFMNGRHKNIFFMNTVQNMMDIPSGIRGCIDFVFITNIDSPQDRKRIYENFPNPFVNLTDFKRNLNKLTTGYTSMVLARQGKTGNNEVTDKVFYYNANPNIPPFRLCKPVFWYLDTKYNVKNVENNEDGVIIVE